MLRLSCTLITLALSLVLSTSAPAQNARQDSSVADKTQARQVVASASAGSVRFTYLGEMIQIRLEVIASSGEILFDSDFKAGNLLDWDCTDKQGERLVDESYLCLITIKDSSGRLTRAKSLAILQNQSLSLKQADSIYLTSAQAQAAENFSGDVASLAILDQGKSPATTLIAHDGATAHLVSGSGGLTISSGDFFANKISEQMRLSPEGNLGIGVKDPQARLDVDGFIRATQGIVFPDGSIQFSASKKTYGPQSAGPGQFGRNPSSGQEHFETAAAGTGTQNFIAKWTETGGAGTLGNSIIFDNGTNVGISTNTPAKKLDVRGGQIALDNSRFLYSRRTNGQFQEAFGIDSNDDIIFNRNSLVPGVDVDAPKASSALIFGTGAGKFFDVRNSANAPMLRIFEATGNVGIGTNNPQAKLDVAGAVRFTGLRTEENATSPNVVGGLSGNIVTAGVVGATIGGGGGASTFNRVTDDFGTIGGGRSNRAGDNTGTTSDSAIATVGGGSSNIASGSASTVGGGNNNTASGSTSTVSGGQGNTASGTFATVPGGFSNFAAGASGFAAGRRAKANHQGAFVWADSTDADFASTADKQFLIRASGGVGINTTDTSLATLNVSGSGRFTGNLTVGGTLNTLSGISLIGLRTEANATSPNVVGGFSGNIVTAGVVGATIGGGGEATNSLFNRVTDNFGTVGGGRNNQAGDNTTSNKLFATVGGGSNNTASGEEATVGGGSTNTASGQVSTIAGGNINTASGNSSTVGGGNGNTASGFNSTVSGGENNIASGLFSTVSGGRNNNASNAHATIGGGSDNIASGQQSTIPGGFSNTAAGNFSFAAGRRAKANHRGTFVWADPTDTDFASTADDQFLIRASGGVGINTNAPSSLLTVSGAGSFDENGAARFDLFNTTAGVGYFHHVFDNGRWQLGTGDSTRILVETNGNVGIGTGASDKLQVAGDIRVGTGTTGCVKDANGTIIAGTCSSDLRYKKQITPFASMIDRLSRLQPVHFYWRADEFKEKHFGANQSYGLIAQEVEKVLPELVTEDESGFKVVNYSKLPLLTIQAIKDLKVENDSLRQQNNAMDARLRALEHKIQKMAGNQASSIAEKKLAAPNARKSKAKSSH